MTDHKSIFFHVNHRDLLGKSSKKLHFQGKLPANVYGLHIDSENIELSSQEFNKIYKKGDELGLVYLKSDIHTQDVPALISHVDFNPVTGEAVHVSFRRVNLTEKVTVEVPIETVGEADIIDANVVQVLSAVEIEALPTDIPEKIEVDVSTLTAIGQSILLQDIVPAGAKYTLTSSEEELMGPVVIVQEVKEEVEPEPVVEPEAGAEGEGATEGEGKTEGEAEEKQPDGDKKPEADKKEE